MEVVEQNQSEVAAVEASTSNSEPQPEVFKLDTDCWDEVFDCLSLEDVHSFGQTCKAFQRVTGEYFQWQYGDLAFDCKEDGVYINYKRMNGFSKFVRKFWFEGRTLYAALLYFGTNCKANIDEFSFCGVDLNQMDMKAIEKCLKKINSLRLICCKFNEDDWRMLLESCSNLKRLIFCYDSDASFTWPVQKHTTLEHLELYNIRLLHGNTLKDFLEHCPNLRSLQIGEDLLWDNQESICDANVDDLAIDIYRDIDSSIGVLNDVHQRDFYKRLHLRSIRKLPSADQLLSLPGLVTLYIQPDKDPKYPVLPDIKEFGFYNWCSKNINTDALATSLINLENLFISGSHDLLPFICRSIKLRDVQITDFKGKVLNIDALNKERKKLKDARKVTIYVCEDVYLATKWATANTSLDLIEMKRQTSRDIVRPHSFWESFR